MEYKVIIKVRYFSQKTDTLENTFKANSQDHALATALKHWSHKMADVEKVLSHSVNPIQ